VKWWGWCREAFEKAKREDKPILLDIGAVWCHWCHVMDEETYSDPEVAQLINELMVPIRVDRDERPDIDRRYQEAAYALTSQAGWPLTAFLTPDGELVWAGTYIPPRDRPGTPGMTTMIKAVYEAWRNRRFDVLRLAEELKAAITAQHVEHPGEVRRDAQLDVLSRLMEMRDEECGGFGGAPKFPPITQVALLVTRWFYDGKRIYASAALDALEAMARGGIHDHLLGGFFRYATDKCWTVPHYEKLLIDNAELMKLYAEATATGLGDYRRVVKGVKAWMDEFMRAPGGGYYASQDADVDGEEGGYYRWSIDELREALRDEELVKIAIRHFGVDRYEWPRGKATLHIAATVDELRRENPNADELLAEAYKRLREARRRRKPPRIDETIYPSWSCAAALAELYSARTLGIGDKDHALATIRRIMRSAWTGDAMARALRGGEALGRGVLDDYAYCALAALEAYAHTADPQYLQWSRELVDAMIRRFRAGKAFTDTDAEEPGIASIRAIPILDTPNWSPNALAITALATVGEATGRRAYTEAAREALEAVYLRAYDAGPGAAGIFAAMDAALLGPPRIVVVDEVGGELHRAALRVARPFTVVVPLPEKNPAIEDPATTGMLSGPRPAAYICAAGLCSLPIRDPAKLAEAARFAAEKYAL